MNLLLSLLSYVAPRHVQRAVNARLELLALDHLRSFEATNPHRLRAKIPTTLLGPRTEVAQNRQNLLASSRDLDRNVSWVHGVWNAIANNVVGMGIRPESRIRKRRRSPGERGVSFDEAKNDQAAAAWDEWARGVDLQGRMSFYRFQWLVERELNVSGEAFVVFSTPPKGTKRKVPLILDLVSAERIATLDEPAPGGGNEIVQGVEFDSEKRIVAYHIYEQDPADGLSITSQSTTAKRVPADRVLHLFSPHRPGAIRGLPRIHSVARTFEALAQYLDFELTRARIASAFALMIKRGGLPLRLPQPLDASETPTSDDAGNPIGQVEGGMILSGGPNDSFESASANIASTSFEPFVKLMLRSAAVGINVSYGFLARDYSDSSFSAARQQYLEDIKAWCPRQSFLVEQLCMPVADEFFRCALVAGVQPFTGMRREEWELMWRTPGWDWVDPGKEMEAELEAIRAGLKSPQESAQERGRDYYEVIEQLAEAKAFAKENGMELSIFQPKVPAATTNGVKKPNPKVNDGEQEDEDTPEA
jgi:lambda family phage portal protein